MSLNRFAFTPVDQSESVHCSFSHTATICAVNIVSIFVSLPSGVYAATAFYGKPEQIGWAWWSEMSMMHRAIAMVNAAGAVTVGGLFGQHYLPLAMQTLSQEWLICYREKKHIKRFVAAMLLGLAAAITGGFVAGSAFIWMSEAAALLFGAAGFIGTSVVSVIGIIGLIAQLQRLLNREASFQACIIDVLKRIQPEYQEKIQDLLKQQPLSADNVDVLLTRVCEELQQLNNDVNAGEVIRQKTNYDYALAYAAKAIDFMPSAILSAAVAVVNIQNGYHGVRIICSVAGTSLDELTDAHKIMIGFFPGLAPNLFAFLSIAEVRQILTSRYPEIATHPAEIVKALGLLGLNIVNCTWFYSLAKEVILEKNIFSLANDFTGQTILGLNVLATFVLGCNGTFQAVYPARLVKSHPTLADMIQYLEHTPLSTETLNSLKKLSLFSPKNSGIDTDEEKEVIKKVDQLPVVMNV